MNAKLDIRGFVNPFTRGETESGQREGMTPEAEIYVEDRFDRVAAKLIASIRRGSIIEVKELHCLAPGNFRPQKRRRLLAERVEAIKSQGGSVREWATRHSSKNGRLPSMMLRAYEQIASSGRARKRDRTGRPIKHELTNEQETVGKGIWHSRRYTNDYQREVAVHKNIGKRIKRGWMRTHWGSPHQVGDKE